MTYPSASSSSSMPSSSPYPSSGGSRSALSYFKTSDWSEDLESSLNSFRSLREFERENDNEAEAEVLNLDSLRVVDPSNVAPITTNDEDVDDADDDDDDQSAASGDGAVRVPEEFICPLTLAVMRDPVVSKFGHSYERDAILGWLVEHRQTCPLTRKPLSLGGIITNHQLRSKIRKWQLENELDITVLCNASDVMLDQDSSLRMSSSKLGAGPASASSIGRLGGFFIVPDLDDTERSTDDEDEDGTAARPATSRIASRSRPGSAAAAARRSRASTNASRRRTSANGQGGGGGSTNHRLVSGISRRLFGGRPPAA